jgi:tetratricopeptide (TPR) repeat protein/DNA-binding CsgD family transcriptional regulator
MKSNQVLPPSLYYFLYFKAAIGGIHFTQREIDIIACIINRLSSKKISSLLNISTRTVETHVRHINQKLESHSRESIIDFIEKAGLSTVLEGYYACLQVNHTFEKILSQLSVSNHARSCVIAHSDNLKQEELLLIHQLKSHLSLMGIIITLTVKKESELLHTFKENIHSPSHNHVIYILTQEIIKKIESFGEVLTSPSGINPVVSQENQALYHLLGIGEEIRLKLDSQSLISLTFLDYNTYFFNFFELLKRFISLIEVDKATLAFQELYKSLNYTWFERLSPSSLKSTRKTKPSIFSKLKNMYPLKRNILKGGIFACCILLIIGFFIFKSSMLRENAEHRTLISSSPKHSNILVPQQSASLLLRPALIGLIEDKFNQKGDIIAVALAGPGGAGKTTLARLYAKSAKVPLAWEINAETQASLKLSLESLAKTLAITSEDKQTFQEISNIKDENEYKEKFIGFISKLLKQQDSWLLIYDNVENLRNLQGYFPQDAGVWGRGNVLLTTRDTIVQSNPLIQGTLQVPELMLEEKLTLFTQIISNGDSNVVSLPEGDTISFLNNLPPYPLDISIAAHYLKAASIPYATYLHHLNNDDEEFTTLQKSLLKESGNYNKTRSNIITLSLQALIQTHKDFADLLLLISLFDSQDIPREIMDAYKKDITVDNFIYHLKKHSFITHEKSVNPLGSTFSIHRSFQEITLAYLIKSLGLTREKLQLQKIILTLERVVAEAVSQDNLEKIKPLTVHCKTLLTRSDLLTKSMQASIRGSLGFINYCLSNYKEAKDTLEEALKELKDFPTSNYDLKAKILSYLGLIIKTVGDRREARDILEKSIHIYKAHGLKNNDELAWALLNLGDVYRTLGIYEKAKDVLEQSLSIYSQYSPNNHISKARALLYLGTVYRDLGDYRRAIDILEQSLVIYKNLVSKDHLRIARILAHLGSLNRELGNSSKAIDYTEQSLAIYQKLLPENHIDIGWTLGFFGKIHTTLGNYQEATKLLEKSYSIHEEFYLQDHIEYAWACLSLGEVYGFLKEFDKAKNLLHKSLKIYSLHYGSEHIETAGVLTSRGQLYMLEGNIKMAENYLNKALYIYAKSNHPSRYKVLESLAEVYLIKACMLKDKGELEESCFYKKKADMYFKQALKVIKTHFSSNSSHFRRVQSKIKLSYV